MLIWLRSLLCTLTGGHRWRRRGVLHLDGYRSIPFMECHRCKRTAVRDNAPVGPRLRRAEKEG